MWRVIDNKTPEMFFRWTEMTSLLFYGGKKGFTLDSFQVVQQNPLLTLKVVFRLWWKRIPRNPLPLWPPQNLSPHNSVELSFMHVQFQCHLKKHQATPFDLLFELEPCSWKWMTQIHPSHFHFSDVFLVCRAHVQAVVVSNVSRQQRSPLSIESFTLKMYPLSREKLKGRVINAACLPRHAPIFNQHQQAAESTPPK